jgi:hypothetical protein
MSLLIQFIDTLFKCKKKYPERTNYGSLRLCTFRGFVVGFKVLVYSLILKLQNCAEVFIMCGRYTITVSEEELMLRYLIDLPTDRYHTPRNNLAPTQQTPVILNENGILKLDSFKWGLILFLGKGC